MTNHSLLSPATMSLLIVDDCPDNLRLMGDLLQPKYRVLAANSGERALAIARRSPQPALILLDIMMPKVDGYEVLRQLRAAPETADIPVIFVTAMDADVDEARGLALGAVDYIAKPIVPELLFARIRTQLELKNARDWLRDRNAVLAEEVARQVVELRAAKDAAEAASHAKSVFINTMSHELRTPMNGVIGMLQMIACKTQRSDELHTFAEMALDSAQAMMKLLGNILDYAALAHGDNMALHPQQIDIVGLVNDVASLWRHRVEEKGLQWRVRCTVQKPVLVRGDEHPLRRVFDILLDNAIAFTHSGLIELAVEPEENEVRLCVRDSGIGIDPVSIPRLFKPFEQLDSSLTRQHQGAGLNLAIAARIVELMGGVLKATSVPQEGSIFSFTLPRMGAPCTVETVSAAVDSSK